MTKKPFYLKDKIPKRFDPAIQFERFESEKASEATRRFRMRVLTKWLDHDLETIKSCRELGEERSAEARLKRKAVKALLKKLENCAEGRECDSPACPVCRRGYRRWYCSNVIRLAKGNDIRFLTYIPKGSLQDLEDLEVQSLTTFKNRLAKRFENKGTATMQAVGSLDLKVTVDGKVDPHFHVIVWGCTAIELKALKKDGRKRGRRHGERINREPEKCGKGAPWVVSRVMPKEWMDVVSYTARQAAKGAEVESRQTRWRYSPASRKSADKDDYYLQHIAPIYERLLVERMLLLDRCTWKDLRILFGVEKKNGSRLRSTLKRRRRG